jgi:2-keto-4-pentenoate hydratase/2-oxohepta-3-ene-1,7-dioic acid hydratase in catechol pathway
MHPIPGIPELNAGTIYCIGRNYQKHAHELGNPVPDNPIVFLKPASSIISDGETIRLPAESCEIHHEVELVIAVGRKVRNISHRSAPKYIAGYGIGIDVTARDIQLEAKKEGHPWSIAKGFDTFAPISSFKRFNEKTGLHSLQLSLRVNNKLRQKGKTGDMIFGIDELIAYLSTIFTLQPGDLIFTGTPEGVSELHAKDTILAELRDEHDQVLLSLSAKVNRYEG